MFAKEAGRTWKAGDGGEQSCIFCSFLRARGWQEGAVTPRGGLLVDIAGCTGFYMPPPASPRDSVPSRIKIEANPLEK